MLFFTSLQISDWGPVSHCHLFCSFISYFYMGDAVSLALYVWTKNHVQNQFINQRNCQISSKGIFLCSTNHRRGKFSLSLFHTLLFSLSLWVSLFILYELEWKYGFQGTRTFLLIFNSFFRNTTTATAASAWPTPASSAAGPTSRPSRFRQSSSSTCQEGAEREWYYEKNVWLTECD